MGTNEIDIFKTNLIPRPVFADNDDDVAENLEYIRVTMFDMLEYLGQLNELQVLAVLLAAVSGTGLAGCLIKCLTKWLYRRFRRGATHLLPTHITDPRAGGPHLDEPTIREAPRPAPRAPPPASDVEEAGRQYEDENSADYRDACCCDEIIATRRHSTTE